MKKFLILIIIWTFFPLHVFSQEIFLSLKKNKVNVRYGPSFDFPVKYIYEKKNLPIKQIDKKENFRRIIDHKKNSGWIHISQLRTSRSLITTNEKILFKKSTKYSKPLAKLDQGRLLKIIKCEEKWCNIKTGDYSGWIIKDNNIWGTVN
mgnify:CR=1 FL=1